MGVDMAAREADGVGEAAALDHVVNCQRVLRGDELALPDADGGHDACRAVEGVAGADAGGFDETVRAEDAGGRHVEAVVWIDEAAVWVRDKGLKPVLEVAEGAPGLREGVHEIVARATHGTGYPSAAAEFAFARGVNPGFRAHFDDAIVRRHKDRRDAVSAAFHSAPENGRAVELRDADGVEHVFGDDSAGERMEALGVVCARRENGHELVDGFVDFALKPARAAPVVGRDAGAGRDAAREGLRFGGDDFRAAAARRDCGERAARAESGDEDVRLDCPHGLRRPGFASSLRILAGGHSEELLEGGDAERMALDKRGETSRGKGGRCEREVGGGARRRPAAARVDGVGIVAPVAYEGVVEFRAEFCAKRLEGGREDAGEGARVGLVEFHAENALARPFGGLKRGLHAAYAAIKGERAVNRPAQTLQKDARDAP